MIAELRRRTGARTGHAGTLDPFATGLLLVLSGWTTKLQPCFVGLDKRYVTDIDLSATTSTGDPEGAIVSRRDASRSSSASASGASRRGVEVAMPIRRSQVYALDLVGYRDGVATLDLRVSSGTYVRSIAIALDGHCRTLRRVEVGPFSVEHADPELMLAPEEALDRLPPEAQARAPMDALRRMGRT